MQNFIFKIHETRKKACESSKIPTVPGPVISLRTFTSENAPLIIPNPKPDTLKLTKYVLIHKYAFIKLSLVTIRNYATIKFEIIF